MIEETLRDAFDAAARTVQPETLRPLTDPDEPPMPRKPSRWPVPIIAAASVTVIVAGSVAVFGRDASTEPPGGPLAGIPRFFVTSEQGDGKRQPSRLRVHDSVTGKVRDTVSGPDRGLSFREVAATGDGRTFIVTAKPDGQTVHEAAGIKPDDCLVRTYRLRITDAGRISRISPIANSTLVNLQQGPEGSLAVTRDGKKIAYSGQSCRNGDHRFKIVIRDLSTGDLREWVDGGTTNIMDLSWAGDGRHLAYTRREMAPPDGTRARGDELLLLDTATAGGAPVAASRTLLRLSSKLPDLGNLTVDPGGSRIFATAWAHLPRPKTKRSDKMVVVGPTLVPPKQGPPKPRPMSVVEIADGRVVRTLYRWAAEPSDPSITRRALKFDASGRHLLVLRGPYGGANRLLRIDNGVAHPLPGGEQAFDIAW